MNLNKFLIPIDFSENAITALKFAVDLAKGDPTELLLLHVIEEKNIRERFQDNLGPEHQMRLWEDHAKSQGCNVRSLLASGKTDRTILETAIEEEVSMIIMGTKGATNDLQKLIGTNASFVLTNAPCPVLVIPKQMPYLRISKVFVAVDPSTENDHTITWISNYLCKPGTHLVLWTAGTARDENDVTEYHKRLTQLVQKQAPNCRVESKFQQAADVSPELEHWLQDWDADLLVMTTHHRNIFEKLFDPGLTRSMSFRSEVPILAIPQVNKPLYFF